MARGVGVRLRFGPIFDAADCECDAPRALARFGNPVSRIGWRFDEPAGTTAAARIVLERRRYVCLDVRPVIQRGARLYRNADSTAYAARTDLHSIPLVEPAVVGADTDCWPV